MTEPIDLEAAERFFALVDAHDVAGDVPDWPAFLGALAWLHARARLRVSSTRCVQVMTLHRAKGLEFDTVILPGLARAPNRGGAEILRWRRRPRGLLLASMKARGGESDPVYRYLRRLADAEDEAELGRLLYVGATRAKRRLHLTACLRPPSATTEPRGGPSPRQARRWPSSGRSFAERFILRAGRFPDPCAAARRLFCVGCRRNGRHRRRSLPCRRRGASGSPCDDALRLGAEAARHVGTVAHRVFAQLAREVPPLWNAQRVSALAPRLRVELAGAGVDEAELGAAVAAVIESVSATLADPRGSGCSIPRMPRRRANWRSADGMDVPSPTSLSIVRSSRMACAGSSISRPERTKVRIRMRSSIANRSATANKLEQYAAFVRALDPRPIRLGLYYPLVAGWREWAYEG